MKTPGEFEIERRVRQYVAMATGLPSNLVIPGNDNNPAPTEPYATVLFMNRTRRGIDAVSRIPDPLAEQASFKLRGSRLMNFSVQFYRVSLTPESSGTLVFDWAESLIGFAETPQGRYVLASLGLVFNKVSDVRNLSGVMADQFEPRAQVDLSFSIATLDQQDVPYIKTIDIGIKEAADGYTLTDRVEE